MTAILKGIGIGLLLLPVVILAAYVIYWALIYLLLGCVLFGMGYGMYEEIVQPAMQTHFRSAPASSGTVTSSVARTASSVVRSDPVSRFMGDGTGTGSFGVGESPMEQGMALRSAMHVRDVEFENRRRETLRNETLRMQADAWARSRMNQH